MGLHIDIDTPIQLWSYMQYKYEEKIIAIFIFLFQFFVKAYNLKYKILFIQTE